MQRVEQGYVRTEELEILYLNCRKLAEELGLKIYWKMDGDSVTGKLVKNDTLIWSKVFTHEYPHMRICMLYDGLNEYLTIRFLNRKDYPI